MAIRSQINIWVLAKRSTVRGANGQDIAHLLFWTGGRNGRGSSAMVSDAYRFSSYDAALDCCGTHDALRDSEEWRVIRAHVNRTPRTAAV